MEHIEPECLDDVLINISSLTNKMAFITIATLPAQKFLSDGRNCHLIVEDPTWWFEKMWKYFFISNFECSKGGCIMYGIPHRISYIDNKEKLKNRYRNINIIKNDIKSKEEEVREDAA
jgi:hypothetical protein